MTDGPPLPRDDRPLSANSPIAWLLSAVFLAKLAIVLGAASRGFEMGDEGTFLLNLHHPDDAPPPFEFYRLLGALGVGPSLGVASARVARVATELIGSFALVAGVFVWARRHVFAPGAVPFALFLALCSSGVLLSIASRSLGYNDVTNLCLYAATGALFAAASGPVDSRWTALSIAAAGFLTGLQVWVKFPPALLAIVATQAYVAFFFPGATGAQRWRLAVIHGAMVGAGAGAVIALSGGWDPLLPRLAIASQLPALTGYQPLDILMRYARYDRWSFYDVMLFAGAFAITVAWLRRARGRPLDAALCIALGVAFPSVLIAIALWHPHFVHPSVVVMATSWVALSSCLQVVHASARRSWAISGLLLLLFALPWVEIMGTNVTLTMRMPLHVLPLFVVVSVVVLDLATRIGCRRFLLATSLLGVAVGLPVFVQHQLLEPYGLPTPIWRQVHEVEGLEGVRVDAATRDFLESAREVFHEAGHRRGDPILALDYMPGLVFYLGGTSPGFNFYMFGSERLNCFNINRMDVDSLPRIVIGRAMSPAQRGCIESFAFPRDFDLVQSLPFPYERVYAGYDAPGLSFVHVYAPKSSGDEAKRDQRR